MTVEQLLEQCKGPQPKPHRPAFRIEPAQPGWRVFDGDRALAHVMPTALDIWSFSPFEPDVMANKTRDSKVLDVHTVHNTWVNLGGQGWPAKWLAIGSAALKWEWPKSSGAQLEGVATLNGPDGEVGRWTLHIRYDETWGRYRYTWEIDARKIEATGFESFNMMISHALSARAETRRFTHSVSPNPDGNLTRIVHSNALFLTHGHWTNRHTTYPSTWVAHLANKTFNPVVIVHCTNVPLMYATCDQLFDQHLIWMNAGIDNVEADGYFHFRMSTEFANINYSAAAKLLEAARDPVHVRPRLTAGERVALPFHMDVVNSFEKEVDPWQPEDCPIFIIDKKQSGNVDWDRTVGHNDKSSIRLTTHTHSDRREIFPFGAVCNVKPKHRYKLEGWIRTKEVARFARLELSTCEYSYTNAIDLALSESVSGSKDWTRVQAILNSGDEAYVLPKLVLYGGGTAWFDDLSLTEVG